MSASRRVFHATSNCLAHTRERKHYTLTLLRENIMCAHAHTLVRESSTHTLVRENTTDYFDGEGRGGLHLTHTHTHTQTSPSSPMSHLGVEDVWERRRMWKAIPHRCCPPHCHPSVGCCAAHRPRPRPGNSSALTTRGVERERVKEPASSSTLFQK